MKHWLWLCALSIIFLSSPANADFYMRPKAGATLSTGGDARYSLGLSAGYRWTKNFSTEAGYSRLFGSGSVSNGDLVDADAILHFPMGPATVYASGGLGALHIDAGSGDAWKQFIDFGSGIAFKLLALQISTGVSYAIVKDADDFIQPYVSVGLAL
ncbi:MAG: hypothetical protein R3A11_01230 [Bdellovibrionota bacterium]